MLFNVDDLKLAERFPLLGAQADLSPIAEALALLEVPAALIKKHTGAPMSTICSWRQGARLPIHSTQIILGWLARQYLTTLRLWYEAQDIEQAAVKWARRRRISIHPRWKDGVTEALARAEELLQRHEAQVLAFASSDYQMAMDTWLGHGGIDQERHHALSLALGERDPVRRGQSIREILSLEMIESSRPQEQKASGK